MARETSKGVIIIAMIKECHKNTINRLTNYQYLKNRTVILRDEIAFAGPKTTAGYSLAPGGSGTSDSTGQLAARIGDKLSELRETEQEIRLIDLAVGMLSAPKKLIIEVRYLTEGGQDKGARLTLRANAKKNKWRMMHHSTYERLRDEAVGEVAKMLGEVEG